MRAAQKKSPTDRKEDCTSEENETAEHPDKPELIDRIKIIAILKHSSKSAAVHDQAFYGHTFIYDYPEILNTSGGNLMS